MCKQNKTTKINKRIVILMCVLFFSYMALLQTYCTIAVKVKLFNFYCVEFSDCSYIFFFLQRTLREIRILLSLKHENIIDIREEDFLTIGIIQSRIADPEPVEPKLFYIWSRNRIYLLNKFLLQSFWRMLESRKTIFYLH